MFLLHFAQFLFLLCTESFHCLHSDRCCTSYWKFYLLQLQNHYTVVSCTQWNLSKSNPKLINVDQFKQIKNLETLKVQISFQLVTLV